MRTKLLTSSGLALAVAATAAHADPPAQVPLVTSSVGLPRAPDFSVESTAGPTRRLRDYLGRVMIVLYEDRDSNQQNNELKRELGEHARRVDLTRDVALVPVANLSSYDFWPAKGYARDAVVDIARQQGYEIMIDWTGAMASSYRFRQGQSHIMIVGRDGRVLFRFAGPMPAQHRAHFFEVIGQAIRAPH